jgi:hypothetical protein
MRHILVGVCQVKFPYVILYYIMLKGSVHFRSFYILLINYDFFLYRMADNRNFFFLDWLWIYWRINTVDRVYVITS